ncbi:tRNA guanosine(34) transglycosylase Tgt [Patescibacteria group bacterium]|nr:tRNA guanosine(34) transglycosylase Tgt [Patescibacteria group bacterium]
MAFSFIVRKQDKKTLARLGVITTPHGTIETPAFVPVGTQASVKSLSPDELDTLGVRLFFVNTYHAYLRPGLSVMNKFGGLHKFMGWPGPIITDSGGFQVFSLARPKYTPQDRGEDRPSLVKISEDGVEFRSHWDGSIHMFTAESSMRWQWELGSDIHIAFDDCTSYPATHAQAQKSMERTHRWALRSVLEHKRLGKAYTKRNKPYQALYGVIQGSVYEDLRVASAKFVRGLDVDGIAIGGVSVGETKTEMRDVLSWVSPYLPADKPRHLLGVGEIDDIFTLIEHGMDTFDCVQPTRLARMGRLYVTKGKTHEIDITKKTWEKDTKPIEPGCTCYTCVHFSRSYLHHLFRVRELLAYRLATIHNIHFINTLVLDIRKAIKNGVFLEMKHAWLYNK